MLAIFNPNHEPSHFFQFTEIEKLFIPKIITRSLTYDIGITLMIHSMDK